MEHEHELVSAEGNSFPPCVGDDGLEGKTPELRGSSAGAFEFTPCAGDVSLEGRLLAAEAVGDPVVLGEEFAPGPFAVRSAEELREVLGRVLQPAREKSLPLLVGLGGLKGSGKDATADWLVARHGFVKLGMSEPVHDALLRFDPWLPLTGAPADLLELLRADQGEFLLYSELTGRLGYDAAKRVPMVRKALQKMGTEVGRWLAEDIWVDKAAEKISGLRAVGSPVVLTGVRFPNELDMLQSLGGAAVWVDRPGVEQDGHDSENSLTQKDFRYALPNWRDLAALYRRTDLLLTQLR